MSRCVSDDTLLLLFEGGGRRAHRTHLSSCDSCRVRYERLAHDLKLIGQVLRELPPLEEISPSRRFLHIGWVPVAVVSAAAFFLVWGKGWVENLPLPTVPLRTILSAPAAPAEVRDEELALLLAETVTPALFSTTDFGVGKLPKHAANLAYLKAALDGGWPSEGCEQSRSQKCDSDPFALLFE